MKPFLDPVTRSKFTFLTGKKDGGEVLGSEFDMKVVEDHFYGEREAKHWSGDEYFRMCKEMAGEMREYYDKRGEEILNPAPKRTGKNQRKKKKKEEAVEA